MIHKIRVWLWGVVAELEYHLYPWKSTNPPQCVAQKYNLDMDYEQNMYYDWLKSHDEKLNKLEENVISLYNEVHKLNIAIGTHD